MAKFGAKSEPEGKDNRRRRDSAKRRSVLIGLAVASLIAGLAGLLTALFYYGGSQRNARQQAVISPPMANTQHPVPVVRSNSKNGTAIGKSARPSGPAVLSKAWIKSVRLPRGTFLAYVPFSQPPLKAVRMARHYRISKAYLPWPGNPWAAPPSVARSLRGVALAKMPFRRDMSGYAAMLAKPPSASMVMTLDAPYYLPHHAYLPWSTVSAVHLPVPARFITAMCRGRHGAIWIATEDHGVFRYTPAAPKGKQVTQFTKQNTKGQLANNNTYALACDNRGRIWAGTLNHGVSVYNGQRWQDYDIVQNPNHKVLAGPLGNHVFALKFDPHTNQMWICTDAGISIYQCSPTTGSVTRHLPPVPFAPGTWHYITQANGLPPNPDCIAFAPGGTVYVGTQSDGIAVGTPVRQPTTINEQRSTLPHIAAGFAGGDGTSTNLPYSAPYRWQITSGPWKMPLTPFGQGLPSNLLNAIAIARNGTVVAGTDGGIAFSTNNGQRTTIHNHHIAVGSVDGAIHDPASAAPSAASHWTALHWAFERGQDFPAKVLGLWHPPKHWPVPSQQLLATLPSEDYTTAIAVSAQRAMTNEQKIGTPAILSSAERNISLIPARRESHYPLSGASHYLWIGHRQRGLDIWKYNAQGKIIRRIQIDSPAIGRYITSLLPLPGGAVAVGTYGKGVSIISLPGTSEAWKRSAAFPAALPGAQPRRLATRVVHEPNPAAIPTVKQIIALRNALLKIKPDQSTAPLIIPLADDWRTEGNWIDRYGTFADVCATMNGDGCDQAGGYHNALFTYRSWVGPAGGPRDYLRYWVDLVHSDQSRVLQDLNRGGRKESEWDDKGEAAARTKSGLGVYCTMHLPAGVFEICAYCDNPNGHESTGRDRDYVVTLCSTPILQSSFLSLARSPAAARELWKTANRSAVIARSRVAGFWGGVYARFVIRQAVPGFLTLAIHRNFSFNTIISGVFVNRIDGKEQKTAGVALLPPPTAIASGHSSVHDENVHDIRAAVKLLNDILAFRRRHPVAYMRNAAALAEPVLRYFLGRRQAGAARSPSAGRTNVARSPSAGINWDNIAGLRQALALLARDAGWFGLAAGIHPPRRLYESYCWKMRTRTGDGLKWQWNQAGYEDYLRNMRESFIASR